jgi:hypothetical protein
MIYIIVLRKGDFLVVNGSIRFYLTKRQAEKVRANNPDEEIIQINLTDLRKFIGR